MKWDKILSVGVPHPTVYRTALAERLRGEVNKRPKLESDHGPLNGHKWVIAPYGSKQMSLGHLQSPTLGASPGRIVDHGKLLPGMSHFNRVHAVSVLWL